MKKILSIFLALVVLMSALCALPVSAASDYGIWYIKVGNNIMVEVKGLGEKSADFYQCKYQNGQMLEYDRHAIVGNHITDVIVMEDGYDYKFIVWADNGSYMPVFSELTLNTFSPNGTGSTRDRDIIKVKAEITRTPKSDSKSCIDRYGNHMVVIKIVDCYEYTVSSVATEIDAYYSGGAATKQLYVGNTNAANLLGQTVVAYIRYDENLDEWKLKEVNLDTKSTFTETITENLNTIYVAYNTVRYYANIDDRKMTEIDIVANPTVYYNGVPLSATDLATYFTDLETLLNSNADSITFIGPKYSAYDKIFVTDYIYKVVKSVNVAEKLIKFDPYGVLDLNAESRYDEDFIYDIYDENGVKIDISDIKKGDVLNIVCPFDGGIGEIDTASYLDIYVTNETVTGKVDEYRVTANKYIIDGEAYTTTVGLTIGEEGVFYLSIDGKIVKKEAFALKEMNFALYMGSEVYTSNSVNSYTFNLFTTEGKTDLKLAEKLKVFNGDGMATIMKASEAGQDYFVTTMNALVTSQSTETAAKANAKARFFAYKINSDNEIVEIRQVGGPSSELIAAIDKPTAKYNADFEEFGGYAIAETPLFIAPVVEITSGNWNIDTDKLNIGNFASLDEDDAFNSYLYTANGEDELAAVLMTDKPSYDLKKAPLAVVSEIKSTVDSDNNTVVSYTIVQNGEIRNVQKDFHIDIADDADLAVGDIFQYAVNTEGEIVAIGIVYDASECCLTGIGHHSTIVNDDVEYLFGVLTGETDGLTLASSVNSNYKATSSVTIPLSASQNVTYALYNEKARNFPVEKINKTDIFKTTNATASYAAVAKMNSSGTIDDVIIIMLDSDVFSTVNDINNFSAWKINHTYYAPDDENSLESSHLAVVEAIGTSLDADDNTVYSYTIVQSGETKTVKADYDEYPSGISGLAVGDIFQYAVNADDEIAEAQEIYDAATHALSSYASTKTVAANDYAFVFGVVAEYADYILFAKKYDTTPGTFVPSATDGDTLKIRVNEVEGATYAWYEEALANNKVKKITINGVRETVRANAVYAAVGFVNENEKVEDIVVVAIDPAYMNTVSAINSFANWKISY